jgi:4'-phosphopantetheinyl transferase
MTLDATDPEITARLAALLDDEERARAARFHFDRDRRTYIAAHALLRSVLAARTGIAPSILRFTAGARGKPELAAGQMPVLADGRSALRFNLSHTREAVAVAVTTDPACAATDLGVDIEAADRLGDYDARIARSFFAEDEAAALEALPAAAERARRFLTLWTLKEAVIKTTGEGLSQKLSGFSIRFPADWPAEGLLPDIEARDPAPPDGLAWHLTHRELPPADGRGGLHIAGALLSPLRQPRPRWRLVHAEAAMLPRLHPQAAG